MKEGRLKGHIAIVTGASRGIGRAIALKLAQEGAQLAICARNKVDLESMRQQIVSFGSKCFAQVVDVKDEASIVQFVSEAASKLGLADILVNNAGVFFEENLLATTVAHWQETIDTNLTGPFLFTKAFLRQLNGDDKSTSWQFSGSHSNLHANSASDFDYDSHSNSHSSPRSNSDLHSNSHFDSASASGTVPRCWGRIVNISSVSGKEAELNASAYCASKFGLIGLTQETALEVSKFGITVNAVCPGWVKTDMALGQWRDEEGNIEVGEAYARLASAGEKIVSVEEVAALVAYLCSNEAGSITGQAINICGGLVFH